jgi:hypothetical protein
MIAGFILAAVGMSIGALTGGLAGGAVAGGAVGGVLGAALGMAAHGLRMRVIRALAEPAPPEKGRVACMITGQVADGVFVRDGRTGLILDVQRCSLCTPNDHIACDKGCVPYLNDALGRHHEAAAA